MDKMDHIRELIRTYEKFKMWNEKKKIIDIKVFNLNVFTRTKKVYANVLYTFMDAQPTIIYEKLCFNEYHLDKIKELGGRI